MALCWNVLLIGHQTDTGRTHARPLQAHPTVQRLSLNERIMPLLHISVSYNICRKTVRLFIYVVLALVWLAW